MSKTVHQKLMEKRNADFAASSDIFVIRFSLPAEYAPLGVPLVHVCKLEGLPALVCWLLSASSVRVLSVQHKRGVFPVETFEIPS